MRKPTRQACSISANCPWRLRDRSSSSLVGSALWIAPWKQGTRRWNGSGSLAVTEFQSGGCELVGRAVCAGKERRLRTGNSSDWLHSLFRSRITLRPFSMRASAPPPPMSPTTLSGTCLLMPRLAQYSFANSGSRSRCRDGEAKSAYGDFCRRAMGRYVIQFMSLLTSRPYSE